MTRIFVWKYHSRYIVVSVQIGPMDNLYRTDAELQELRLMIARETFLKRARESDPTFDDETVEKIRIVFNTLPIEFTDTVIL